MLPWAGTWAVASVPPEGPVEPAAGPRGVRLASAPMDVTLLGPQRRVAGARTAVAERIPEGPVATVNAGWRERESDTAELDAVLGGRMVNLELYRRGRQLIETDPAYADAERRLLADLAELRRAYQLRLRHGLAAVRAVSQRVAREPVRAAALVDAVSRRPGPGRLAPGPEHRAAARVLRRGRAGGAAVGDRAPRDHRPAGRRQRRPGGRRRARRRAAAPAARLRPGPTAAAAGHRLVGRGHGPLAAGGALRGPRPHTGIPTRRCTPTAWGCTRTPCRSRTPAAGCGSPTPTRRLAGRPARALPRRSAGRRRTPGPGRRPAAAGQAALLGAAS